MAIKKFKCENEWCPVTTIEIDTSPNTIIIACKKCDRLMPLVPSLPAKTRTGSLGKGGDIYK